MTKRKPVVHRYQCCAHCHGMEGHCLAGGFHDQPCEYSGCTGRSELPEPPNPKEQSNG